MLAYRNVNGEGIGDFNRCLAVFNRGFCNFVALGLLIKVSKNIRNIHIE